VSVAALRSLDEVRDALTAKLGAQTLRLGPVMTRVMLRTGASLKVPRPDQNRDQAVITKVVAALADLGYPL